MYTQAPVMLGKLVSRDGERWLVAVGANSRAADVDESVDPALLDQAFARGSRVLLDATDGEPVIVGVLQTARALEIDREGNVAAQVQRLTLDVEDRAVVRSSHAFIQVSTQEVELYGRRVLVRAREVAKVLARLISMN